MPYGWIAACGVVFAVVFGYERDLQIRNKSDREAMDQLFNRLCELAGIDADSAVRERKSAAQGQPVSWWSRYGWAFPWQMILLLLAAVVSAYLPFVS